MAKPERPQRFETIEAAKTWLEANPSPEGVTNTRQVYRIDYEGGSFYVVTITTFKARAIAAALLGIEAHVAEPSKGGGPRKPLIESVKDMKPDELARLKALLAEMENPPNPDEMEAPTNEVAAAFDDALRAARDGDQVEAELTPEPEQTDGEQDAEPEGDEPKTKRKKTKHKKG
jgi:hypothetical protein